MRKLLPKVKFTPEQLEAKLKAAGYEWHEMTPAQWAMVTSSAIGYRYDPVLKNKGPYKKFVLAYLDALTGRSSDEIKAVTYTVMGHAITEMRRAHQHSK